MKTPVLTNKGKAIVITLSVIVGICAILLFAAWAYGYTHNMTFGDVMTKCFDSEKYNLNTEVKNLTKVKLGYESTIKDYTENIETQRETIMMLELQYVDLQKEQPETWKALLRRITNGVRQYDGEKVREYQSVGDYYLMKNLRPLENEKLPF